MKKVLTIAGSDCSGGAGIQADIKTMSAHGVYAMSVITAVTAQNTLGVQGVSNIDTDFVKMQLESVFEDIFPDAVKIGMLSTAGNIRVVTDILDKYKPKNIVLDPVMISTSGRHLLDNDALELLTEKLLKKVTVVTPNIPEAEVLSDMHIENDNDIIEAAKCINKKYGCSVLIKGGHSVGDANDLLYFEDKIIWYKHKRVDNPNNHGTGCTLSSAIASNLALGYDMEEAVKRAKEYLTKALEAMLDIGHGNGPLNHLI